MDIRIDVDDEFLGVLFWTLMIIAGISVIAWAVITNRRQTKNEACPVRRMHATVVDKPQIPANTLYALVWVSFQLEDGSRVRLNMPYQKAPLLGDSGMLTWQGDAMQSFQRDGDPVSSQSIYGSDGTATSGQGSAVAQPSGYIPTWKRIEMEEAAKKENRN